jgi:hypothetical protein
VNNVQIKRHYLNVIKLLETSKNIEFYPNTTSVGMQVDKDKYKNFTITRLCNPKKEWIDVLRIFKCRSAEKLIFFLQGEVDYLGGVGLDEYELKEKIRYVRKQITNGQRNIEELKEELSCYEQKLPNNNRD